MNKKERNTKIENLLTEYKDRFWTFFREIDKIAEKSMEEFETTKYLANQLEDLGISYKKLSIKTGLFGTLNFNKLLTVAFRADIDALPLPNGGYAHMCGHSSHAAALLTALTIIKEKKLEPSFNLRFVFQPGEEIGAGAHVTIKEKAYEGVDYAISLHNYDKKPKDLILGHGPLMSGSEYTEITLTGTGGHSSRIYSIANPLQELIKIVTEIEADINQIPNFREHHASFCLSKLNAGKEYNVIPSEANATLAYRFYDEKILEQIHAAINKHTSKKLTGLKIAKKDYKIMRPLVNNEKAIDFIRPFFNGTKINVRELSDVYETPSEDFAYVIEKYPGVQLFLGIGKPEVIGTFHTPSYRGKEGDILGLVRVWLSLLVAPDKI